MHISRRLVPTSLSLAVLWLLVAPSTARAQVQAPPPEEDRPALQIGPVEIRPRVILTNFGVDNNVFNEHDDPKQDFTFTLSPDVQVGVNPGRFRLSYTGGSDFVYFHTYTSERSVGRRFLGRADADLGNFRPFLTVSANHTSARANGEVDVRGRHHPRALAAGSTVKTTSKTSVGFTFRRATEDFDEDTIFRGQDLAETLNNTTTIYEGAVYVELTPLTTFSLVVSQEQMRFESATVRDSDTVRIAPTFSFSPSGILNGTASVGYRRLRAQSALEDYNGFVATGTLGAAIADRYKIETIFTHDVKCSRGAAALLRAVGGPRGLTTILAAASTSGQGRPRAMSYRALAGAPDPGTTRSSSTAPASAQITPRALRLEAEFTDRTSTGTCPAIRNHRILRR